MSEENKEFLMGSAADRIKQLVDNTFRDIEELEKKLKDLEPKKETEAVQKASALYYRELAELQKENLTEEEYEARREELFKPLDIALTALNEAKTPEYRKTENRLAFLQEEMVRIFKTAYEDSVKEFIQLAGDDRERILQKVKQQTTLFLKDYITTAEQHPDYKYAGIKEELQSRFIIPENRFIKEKIEEIIEPFRQSFKDDQTAQNQISAAIAEAMTESPYVLDRLPILTDTAPITHAIAMHDKIFKRVFEPLGMIYGETYPIALESKKNRKEITATIILYNDDPESPLYKVRFTEFERRVYEACVTLAYNGKRFLTWTAINKAMLADSEARLTEKRRKQIISCIEKFTTNRIYIDQSDILRSWDAKDITVRGSIKEPLLFGRIRSYTVNGQGAEGVELADDPILFRTAKITRQFDTISPEVLRLPTGVKATDENLILIRHLYQRVSTIVYKATQKQNDHSDHIALKPLYEIFGATNDNDTAQRKKRQRVRDTTAAILDNWQKNKAFDGFAAWYWIDSKGEVIKRTAKTKTKQTQRTRGRPVNAIWIVTPQNRITAKKA